MSKIPTAAAYLNDLTGRIGALLDRNADAIARAAEAVEKGASAARVVKAPLSGALALGEGRGGEGPQPRDASPP